MGHAVLAASRKGGTGKTTICSALGTAAAERGLRVLLVDLDPQKSLRRWWERREAGEPQMLEDDPTAAWVARSLDQLRRAFDLVLIDTPAQAPDWLAKVSAPVDLVLVPIKPSPHDIGAVAATVGAIGPARWVFILSQVAPRTRIAQGARVALGEHGRVAPVEIVERVRHRDAAATGQAAFEGREGDAAAGREIAELLDWIGRDIGASWAPAREVKKGATL